jgi:hypothetical protein
MAYRTVISVGSWLPWVAFDLSGRRCAGGRRRSVALVCAALGMGLSMLLLARLDIET